MSVTQVERRLVVGITRFILDCDLSGPEASEAAMALRTGTLLTGIIALLDTLGDGNVPDDPSLQKKSAAQTNPTDSLKALATNKRPPEPITPDALFDIVKKRKITRGTLFEVLRQVNKDASSDEDSLTSMREALTVFRSLADIEDWKLLSNMISGNMAPDPYMAGILKR